MTRFRRHALVAAALSATFALAIVPAEAAKKRKVKPAPAAATAAALPAGQAAAPATPAASDVYYKADALSRISRALNAVTTLKADFTQVDVKGVSSGRFYLARPGKLRFEYDPPTPTLIVADGKRVTVRDLKMKTDYRAKIGETPLRLLLNSDIDLNKDARVTDVQRDGNQLAITAVETKGYGQGQITFIFRDPGGGKAPELERWIVVDPTGAQTAVTLSEIEQGVALEASLFELPRQASFENRD